MVTSTSVVVTTASIQINKPLHIFTHKSCHVIYVVLLESPLGPQPAAGARTRVAPSTHQGPDPPAWWAAWNTRKNNELTNKKNVDLCWPAFFYTAKTCFNHKYNGGLYNIESPAFGPQRWKDPIAGYSIWGGKNCCWLQYCCDVMLFCRYAPTFRTWLLSEAPIKRRNQEGMNMCKNKCEDRSDRSELGILFLFFSFLFVSNCFYMACSVLQAPCRPCLMKSTGAGVHDTFLPAGRIRQQDAARGLLSQPPISSFFDGNRKRVTTYAFFLQPQWLNTQFLMGRSGR